MCCRFADLPNGSDAVWALYRIEKLGNAQMHKEPVCSYPCTVKGGAVKAHIPARYAYWIKQGTARIVLHVNNVA
jgi:hypothetical protein